MKITAQPHIWPGRNLGIAFARTPDGIIVSSVCCLDCGWASDWYSPTAATHQAGWDHFCGIAEDDPFADSAHTLDSGGGS